MPLFSVIIPSYNHLLDCLRPCCESLIRNTTINETIEILIVANGCTDGTQEYVLSLGSNFRLVDCPQPLGYPKAINEGLKMSTGEYIVLLNNDTVLIDADKDYWLNLLYGPFTFIPNCGITGPIKRHIPHLNENFLIFFCVMISRNVFMKLGYMDETFSPGSGEDIDYCIKAVKNGFELIQVPYGQNITQGKDHMVGGFPIYHAAEKTVHEIPNWTEIFNRNMEVINSRYKKDTPL
jgi:GT2 family glycosyltransferase